MNFISILGSTTGLGLIVSLLLLGTNFVFSYLMTSQDYGLYTYFNSLYLILLNIVPFGSAMAVVAYRFKVPHKEYSKVISAALLGLMPVILIILSLIIFFFVDNKYLYLTVLLSAYFYSILIVLTSYYRVGQLFFKLAKLFIVSVLMFVTVQVISYTFVRTVESVFLGGTFILAVVCLYCFRVLFRKKILTLEFLSLSAIYERFVYGIPVVLSSALMSLLVVGDKILLKQFLDPIILGKYAKLSLVASLLLFVVNIFAAAWGGYLAKLVPEIEKSEYESFFRKAEVWVLRILFLFPIVSTIQYFVYTLLYDESGFDAVIFLLSFTYYMYGISKFYIGFLNIEHLNKYVASGLVLGILLALTFYSYLIFYNIGHIFSLGVSMGLTSIFLVFYLRSCVISKVIKHE